MTNEFPPKPARKEDFDKPVSWLVGRDLIAGLKWFALFAAFKGKIDPRDWMSPNCFPAKKDLNLEPGFGTGYDDRKTKELAKVLEFWRLRNDRAWQWKVANDSYWAGLNKTDPEFWKRSDAEEFWFDYIADSGDGQMGTYGVAYLCLSDVWMKPPAGGSNVAETVDSEVSFKADAEHTQLLPRGSFLFVGGDTTYHIADYNSLRVRFQEPFRWAFSSIRNWLKTEKRLLTQPEDDEGHIPRRSIDGTLLVSDTEPARPIFGVPGNHDYYDVIDGFNIQFRKPAVREHQRKRQRPQLSLLGFERQQNASYVAIQLPFGWWLWGLDTEVSQLDVRQEEFFKHLNEDQIPEKLILATPEPTTVFRQRKPDDDKTLLAYAQLDLKQPFAAAADQTGHCRLDLSGDVHHYARYFGPKVKPDPQLPNSEHYASVVSGGGGAFMHPSQTHLIGDGAVEEQRLYPPADVSRMVFAKPLFDLRNIFNGGYVWLFGMVIAFTIYFALTVPQSSKDFMEWIAAGLHIPFTADTKFTALPSTGFDRPIVLKGFIWATLDLIGAMLLLGGAIYFLYRYTKQLEKAPVEYDEDVTEQTWDSTGRGRALKVGPGNQSQQTAAAMAPQVPAWLPTTYGKLWRVWLAVVVSVLLYVVGVITCEKAAGELHPFGSSLLVLAHVILGVELSVLAIQTSAWLFNRSNFVRSGKYSYLPVWLLTAVSLALVFFGVWMFGRYPGAYVLSDSIFALLFVAVFFALTYLGFSLGGKLQPWPGKILMLLVGLFHGLLQLLVPLLLIRIGDWRAVLIAILAIIVFSGCSIPRTFFGWSPMEALLMKLPDPFGWPGLGAFLMKLPDPLNGIGLTVFWFIYGGLLLALPFFLHSRRAVFVSGGVHASSFLPQSVVTWITNLGFVHEHPAVSLLVISLAAAAGIGFLLSMSLLSWYFAVALVFQGHNNEVGGAGRVEKFRHILRIRVTRDKLTVYGIGFDEPAVDGHNLKPKIIDAFELRTT